MISASTARGDLALVFGDRLSADEPRAANLFFQVVAQRYDRGSMILTPISPSEEVRQNRSG